MWSERVFSQQLGQKAAKLAALRPFISTCACIRMCTLGFIEHEACSFRARDRVTILTLLGQT